MECVSRNTDSENLFKLTRLVSGRYSGSRTHLTGTASTNLHSPMTSHYSHTEPHPPQHPPRVIGDSTGLSTGSSGWEGTSLHTWHKHQPFKDLTPSTSLGTVRWDTPEEGRKRGEGVDYYCTWPTYLTTMSHTVGFSTSRFFARNVSTKAVTGQSNTHTPTHTLTHTNHTHTHTHIISCHWVRIMSYSTDPADAVRGENYCQILNT